MILIVVPLKSNMSKLLRARCLDQLEKLRTALGNKIEIVLDDRGPGDSEIRNHTERCHHMVKIRQALVDEYLKPHHIGILWLDADIRYDVETIEAMIAHSGAVIAPLVLYESKTELGMFEGAERFYDTSGFIEDGRQTPVRQPFFQQKTDVVNLDSVGAFYLIPASVFRAGGKYEFKNKGYTEHYSVCQFAKKMGLKVICDTRLKVWHACLEEYGEVSHSWSQSDNSDPLDNMNDFILPNTAPVTVPITTIVMETRSEMMGRIRRITEWHRKWFKFHREIIISDKDPHIEGTTFISCGNPPENRQVFLSWYSDMCVKGMVQLCDAPFVLMWQWDGFIVNPGLWTNEFLNYDYIGAPIIDKYWLDGAMWLMSRKKINSNQKLEMPMVGNGGFSLRSKRFLEVSATMSNVQSYMDDPGYSRNEDFYLCVRKRQEMEQAGIRFSPVDLAYRFAKEGKDKAPLNGCFGFHNTVNLNEVKKLLESKWMKQS